MKLILFDIDGTLICSGGAGRKALDAAFFSVLGVRNTMSGFSLGGLTDALILERVFEEHADAEMLPADAGEQVIDIYLEHLRVEIEQSAGYKVLPGVLALIQRLSRDKDVTLALGTGNIEAGARVKLGRGALNEYFSCGGFGSDGYSRPEILQAGVRRAESLQQGPFDSIWVVGDTCHDVRAARAIGATVLAVATGTESVDELEKSRPDLVVDLLSEPSAWDALRSSGASET